MRAGGSRLSRLLGQLCDTLADTLAPVSLAGCGSLPLLDRALPWLHGGDALDAAAIPAAAERRGADVVWDDIREGVVCRRIAGLLGPLVPQGAT